MFRFYVGVVVVILNVESNTICSEFQKLEAENETERKCFPLPKILLKVLRCLERSNEGTDKEAMCSGIVMHSKSH